MGFSMILCLSLVVGFFSTAYSADPIGCTYFASERKYECSARTCSFPLDYTTFDNVPQVMHLTEFSGELAASAPLGPTFSNFISLDTTGFDTKIVPSMVLRCYAGGSVIMSMGALAGMHYIQDFRVINCNIYNIPDEMFADLVDLNYLGIEGGSIHTLGFNAFTLLNIDAMAYTANRESSGTLSIRNCNLVDGKLPNGVLYSLTNVKHIVLENTNIATLQSDMFQVTTEVMSLTLSNNPFTTFPEDLFNSMLGLISVEAEGIDWECSCTNLWFLDYAEANNITLRGDYVCASPADQQGKRLYEYKQEFCTTTETCGSISGVALGNYCLSAWSIANSCVTLISLTVSCVALGIAICTVKELSPMLDKPDNNGKNLSKKSEANGIAKKLEADRTNKNVELTKMKKEDGQVFVGKWEGF
ncbi:leucine-rich repeat-containing protein 70-like [Argopecten irradians]|uniref:leucine-rich repeat-containing protein 70-like n=1 Tax=Argopecten irradians TaxID=31199 RepID=UPI00371CF9BB